MANALPPNKGEEHAPLSPVQLAHVTLQINGHHARGSGSSKGSCETNTQINGHHARGSYTSREPNGHPQMMRTSTKDSLTSSVMTVLGELDNEIVSQCSVSR